MYESAAGTRIGSAEVAQIVVAELVVRVNVVGGAAGQEPAAGELLRSGGTEVGPI